MAKLLGKFLDNAYTGIKIRRNSWDKNYYIYYIGDEHLDTNCYVAIFKDSNNKRYIFTNDDAEAKDWETYSVKLVIKKASSKAYDIYEYLKKNCIGKKNACKVSKLCKVFGTDRRSMRAYLTEINEYMDFDKVVCRINGVYLAKYEDELSYYINYKSKKIVSELKELNAIKKKAERNNQMKMQFTKAYKEIRECVEDNE